MTEHEYRNRRNKAHHIAAVLVACGVTAEDAAAYDDAVWRIAARAAAALSNDVNPGRRVDWTDASPATRREVFRMLDADQAPTTDDPFAGFPR